MEQRQWGQACNEAPGPSRADMMKNKLQLAVALLAVALTTATLCKAAMQKAYIKTGGSTATSLFTLFENPKDLVPSFSKPDLFLNQNLSVGEATPINSDPMQTWRAGQARAWFDLPDALTSARLFVQGGLGFLRTDPFTQSYGFFATPSFMIPFGFGIDSMTNSGLRLTTMLMLAVTQNLWPSPQAGPQISPGLLFRIGF